MFCLVVIIVCTSQRDSIDLDASKVDSSPAIHLVVPPLSQILPRPSPTLLSAVTTVIRDGPASCCILLAPSPDICP